MCVSLASAEFSATTIVVYKRRHPIHGDIVVLGYANTAVNYNRRPNALVLHFPTADPMTQSNFIDTQRVPRFMQDLRSAVQPSARSLSTRGVRSTFAEIFTYGIYTVVLASDASAIPAALEQVPQDKRPDLNPRLFHWYAQQYPGWSIALCCFNNRYAQQASPLLMWYKPQQTELLIAPTLDCHTGDIPNLYDHVDVDHTLILATDDMRYGEPVMYRDHISPDLMDFLPLRVVGRYVSGQYENGDFAVPVSDVQQGGFSGMHRLPPPTFLNETRNSSVIRK